MVGMGKWATSTHIFEFGKNIGPNFQPISSKVGPNKAAFWYLCGYFNFFQKYPVKIWPLSKLLGENVPLMLLVKFLFFPTLGLGFIWISNKKGFFGDLAGEISTHGFCDFTYSFKESKKGFLSDCWSNFQFLGFELQKWNMFFWRLTEKYPLMIYGVLYLILNDIRWSGAQTGHISTDGILNFSTVISEDSEIAEITFGKICSQASIQISFNFRNEDGRQVFYG